MKYIIEMLLIFFVVGCADRTLTVHEVPNPTPIAGPQGQQGATGAQGATGETGTPGQDAHPVSVIQLCGTCVASYPSVFPETGVCINDKLYGVYSANGGFLVELTPGAYGSNGINCSCSFTIAKHCVVN